MCKPSVFMVLGIATGCFWQVGEEEIEILRFLKQLGGIDAIELVFAFPQELFDFRQTREDTAFLRSKKYVSIHAPFHEVEYGKGAETKKMISTLDSLVLKIGAKHIVFHSDCIKDFSVFDNVNFVPLVENLDSKEGVKRIIMVRQVEDFLQGHKNFGFCLDIGDAMLEGINPKDFLQFRERLAEIHIHFPQGFEGKMKPHGSPSKADKKFLELAKPALSAGFPIIFEATDFFSFDKGAVEKELEIVKSLM